MAKVIPALSVDARMVFERLATAPVGETVTYKELNALIGRDTQNGGRPVIASARRKAMSEHRMVFAVVKNVGLKRLNDVEIVDTAQHDLSKVHRAARRAGRRITMVEFDKLPNDRKVRHNTFMSMFGALHSMTTQGSVKILEKRVAESQAALPLAKTLEVFQK
jgi:hypothetical protein